MNDRLKDLVMIGQRKYAEFAKALGLSHLGSQLIVNNKVVGCRTKKHVYVDPTTYAKVFGKRPFGALPDYLDKQNNTTQDKNITQLNQKNIKCPKCRSLMNPVTDQSHYINKCSRCGFKY